jgi:uncharacterized RDD family membrane protein YckC
MRCPKCQYISFENSDRCRNCGYEFSLAVDTGALDLPIQTGDEALGPLAEFSLDEVDRAASGARSVPGPADQFAAEAGVTRRSAAPPTDLPLFKDRTLDDDAPLVTLPATPRMPVAVRRSSPAVPRPHRSANDEPELVLDLDGPEPAPEPALEPPPSRAEAQAGLAHPVAGLGPRALAGLIDLAILGGIDVTVLYFTLKICGFTRQELLLLPMVPLVAFLVLLNGGYFVAFIAAGGQTLGKMAANIKVVPAEPEGHWSDRVPLGTAFMRAAASLVSLAPAGAGYLPALLDPDRRTVHDRLAHTRVVKA